MANPGRPTSSPRRKSGGGIMALIGGLSGAGAIEGGGYVPGEEVFAEADFGSEAPPVSSRPASFTPYTVKNPTLDAIFGRGMASQQAMGLNAQQQMMMAQADMQRQLAEMTNTSAMQREMAGQAAATERQKLLNANAIELAGINVDAPNLTGSGTPFSKRADWAARVGDSAVGAAGNQMDARFRATTLPGYQEAVADNVFAQQQKLPIEVRAAGAITAPQNTDIYTPKVGDGMFPNQRISGSSTDQRVEMTGGTPVEMDGKMVLVGQKPEVVTSRHVGGVVNEDARLAKEEKAKAELAAAKTGGSSSFVRDYTAMQPGEGVRKLGQSPAVTTAEEEVDKELLIDALMTLLQKNVPKAVAPQLPFIPYSRGIQR